MKTFKLVALVFLFSTTSLFSQAVVNEPNQFESTWRNLQVVRNMLNNDDKTREIDFKDIKGSPYYKPEFRIGKFYADNKLIGNFNLRYNLYSDEIETVEDSELGKPDSEQLKIEAFFRLENTKAIIDNEEIIFYKYRNEKSSFDKGYFIVLNKSDSYTLLQKKRCVLTPAQKAATFNEADRAAKFTIYDDYYILEKESQFPKKIENKKNKIVKMFPGKEGQLKQFIKKNKIDLKKTSDLITFLNHALI